LDCADFAITDFTGHFTVVFFLFVQFSNRYDVNHLIIDYLSENYDNTKLTKATVNSTVHQYCS